MFVVLELLDQPFDFVLACCILRLDCRKRYSRYSVIHGVVTRFHRNFSNRSMVPKMILLLGFVDLVDHIASSIWVQPVTILELSEPSGRAPPEFPYIPLSQCKLQTVCCRERLHVTVSVKFASLSLERPSNCTKYCILKACRSILVWRDTWFRNSLAVSLMPKTSSIAFTVVNKTACLPLLRLVPPGLNPFLIIEFNSFAFPMW